MKTWQIALSVYVAIEVGLIVMDKFQQHGVLIASLTLLSAMVAINTISGWVKWVKKK